MANSIFEWEKKYKIWINVLALLFFPLAVIAGITLASHSFGWGLFLAILTICDVIAIFVLAGVDTYKHGGKGALRNYANDMLNKFGNNKSS